MTDPHEEPPRYKWPWFVLALVLLGTVLFILWVTAAAKQTREMRESNPFAMPSAPHNR